MKPSPLRSRHDGAQHPAEVPLEDFLRAAMDAPLDRRIVAFRFLRGEVANLTEVRPPPPPEPYLSLRGLANAMGVSGCTLWRWKVPGHDLGGRKRYKRSEVEMYLKSEAFARRSASLRAERKEPSRRDTNPEKGRIA